MDTFTPKRKPGSSSKGSSAASTAQRAVSRHTGGPSLSSKILVVLLMVTALMVILSIGVDLFGKRLGGPVDDDKYQALFLTNGQVYFGKLDNINSGYVKLSDIYYLQVSQNQQQDDSLQPADQTAQPSISLVKLGNELHGPEDEMFVSRDQVLFWENLKSDGNVTQAIQQYVEDNSGEEQ